MLTIAPTTVVPVEHFNHRSPPAAWLDVQIGTTHAEVAPHRQIRTELFVVLAGRARLRVGGMECLVSAGSGTIIRPGKLRSLSKVQDLQYARIVFDGSRVLPDSALLIELGALGEALTAGESNEVDGEFQIDPRHLSSVGDVARRLRDESQHERMGRQLALGALFCELLVVLARGCASSFADPQPCRERLASTLDYIQRNYREPICLAELARIAGMSVNRLLVTFRGAVGASPHEYVTDLRMQEARELLSNAHRSITEVAFDVGYQDSNYFSRAFKQRHGLSPRDFRRESRVTIRPTAMSA